jgi:hypothetical protein
LFSGFGFCVPVAALFALLWVCDMSLLVVELDGELLLAIELLEADGELLLADWLLAVSDIELELGLLAAAAEVVSAGAPVVLMLELLLWHLSETIFTSVTCSVCCALLVLVSLAELAVEELAVAGVPVISTVCPTCGWS